MNTPDKRLQAFRADLADEALLGKVDAKRFVKASVAQCVAPVAGIHRAPAADATQISQVLYGEVVSVFERKDGWAWVQLKHDSYVGYVEESALTSTVSVKTHRLPTRSSHLYPAADLKTQPAVAIPLGAEVTVVEAAGDFTKLDTGQFIYAQHLSATPPTDFVSVAEQFLHTPYLWGGKTIWGLDCSGLVQISLQAVGKSCLRDSDMQEQSLGHTVSKDDLQRGDLIFWKGHVGIMQDATTLLHANGYHLMVVSEPLTAAVNRISAKGSEITSVKRL